MKNKFTLGAIAGMSSIALAIPIAAQISSAQDTGSSASTTANASTTNTWKTRTRAPLTQAEIQKRIDMDSSFLANIDAMIAIQKPATQAHKDALTAAAAITDDTQRQTAVEKAQTDFRTAIQTALTANPNLKSAMMMPLGMGGPGGFGGRGHGGPMMGADFATKLGMTEADLKAALAGGKTIQQIAQEKGVTLPARPAFMGHMKGQKAPTAPTAQ